MNQSLGFEVTLDKPFDQAVEAVTAALKTEGFGILTKIDVKATIKEKLGEDFRPYVILGACNPPLAHKALTHAPEVGMMLPCNVTVEATPQGGSLVRIADPDMMLGVGELGKDTTLRGIASQARERLKRVSDALQKT
jgi:uncharacterized protein (DUF302 family)